MRRRAMIAALGATAPLIGARLASAAPAGGSPPLPPRNARALADYLPASRAEDALRGIDSRTDHSPYLQAMIDDGIEQIDLGFGTFNLKTPLRPRGNTHWRGRQRGTTLRSSINGYIVDASAGGQRLGLEDMIVKGDPSRPRSAGFRLFDPSTYNVRRIAFSDFSREALHFVQGVLIAVEDCTIVDCGKAAGSAGLWFDPGETATVMPVVSRCYIAKCGTGLKAELARALRVDDSIFETNQLATELARCDGIIANSWFEANAQDGSWTDCTGLARLKVSSTNLPSGRWRLIKTSSSANPAVAADGEIAFAEMRNRDELVATAAGRWDNVLFGQGGSAFNANPRAGDDSAVLQVGQRGFYEITYRTTLRNGGTGPGSAALRIVIEGTEMLEATGSYCEATLPGGAGTTLAGSVLVHLPRDARLRLQWTVDNTAVRIAGGSRGLARSADPTNAYLAVRHLGAER